MSLAGVTIDSLGMRITNVEGVETWRIDFPPEPAPVPPPPRPEPRYLTVGEVIAELAKLDPAAKVVAAVDLDYDDYWGWVTRVEVDDDGDVSLVAGE